MIFLFFQILNTRRSDLSGITAGHIQTLVSTDIDKLDEFVQFLIVLLSTPFTMIGFLSCLWLLISPLSLCGAIFYAIPVLYMSSLTKLFTRLREHQAILTDHRLTIIHEVVSGIRAVKAFGWENNYIEDLKLVRR